MKSASPLISLCCETPCSPVPPPNYLRKILIIAPSLVPSTSLFLWSIMSHLGALFSCKHPPWVPKGSYQNYCLLRWFSKCGPCTTSSNIAWKLFRNADYSSSLQTHWTRNWGRAPRWFWPMIRVENYWPIRLSIIFSILDGSRSSTPAYQFNSVGIL